LTLHGAVELTGKISSDKFAVLGFPCNQFGGQEPGSNAEIKKFAEGKGAKFSLFSKEPDLPLKLQ